MTGSTGRQLRWPFLTISGPWRTKKGRQRPQFDCFAHNVTTTVSMSWEGFFLSWEGRFIAGGGNDFYVGGTAPSRHSAEPWPENRRQGPFAFLSARYKRCIAYRFPHPFCTRLQNLIKFQVSSNCQILRLQAPPDLVTLRAKDTARKRDWRARRVEFDAAVNEAPFSSWKTRGNIRCGEIEVKLRTIWRVENHEKKIIETNQKESLWINKNCVIEVQAGLEANVRQAGNQPDATAVWEATKMETKPGQKDQQKKSIRNWLYRLQGWKLALPGKRLKAQNPMPLEARTNSFFKSWVCSPVLSAAMAIHRALELFRVTDLEFFGHVDESREKEVEAASANPEGTLRNAAATLSGWAYLTWCQKTMTGIFSRPHQSGRPAVLTFHRRSWYCCMASIITASVR